MPTPSATRDDAANLGPDTVDTDGLAAEYDEERPSRHLSPKIDRLVAIWCFLVALFVLRQIGRAHV